MPWLDRSIETLQAALAREPRHVQVRQQLRNGYRARGRAALALGRPADAAADFDRALAMDDGSRRQAIRLDRATAWARAGEPDRAVAEAEALLAAGPPSGELNYSAACVFAQSSAARRRKAGGRGDGDAQAERDATRTLALLTRAAAGGWFAKPTNRRNAQIDPDLNPVRDRPDVRLLMMDISFPSDPFSSDR